ncbi:Disease resistance protein RPP13 [Spatholobus suberectus]|nr:Disease resistance protein RPP13 [Spatholobus suberectus]
MESEKDFKLVGREKEKEEIIDQLILLRRGGNEANPPVPVIIIAGLAGIGKTKLALHVCQDENVKQHVGLPALVSGTNCNSFDADSIAKQVIESAVPGTASSRNRIVILDDWRVEIGDQDVKALQLKLKKARLCVTAIMITTRSCLVAKNIAASPVKSYDLPGLNEEESASLFEKTGRRGADDNSSNTKITEQCRGVPGAIMTMAKWLQSSRSQQLTEFTEKLKDSYYDEGLPQLCFTYCSLFPQDYLFDAERLNHLWMAEGFLNHSNPSTSLGSEPDPEETGRGYLKELVGRSIFQVVEEDEFGKVRSCRMHPLMHDIARFVAPRENITVDPNGDKVHQQVQRASFDLSLLGFERGIPAPLFDKAKQLRSILFFSKTRSRRLRLLFLVSSRLLV